MLHIYGCTRFFLLITITQFHLMHGIRNLIELPSSWQFLAWKFDNITYLMSNTAWFYNNFFFN